MPKGVFSRKGKGKECPYCFRHRSRNNGSIPFTERTLKYHIRIAHKDRGRWIDT